MNIRAFLAVGLAVAVATGTAGCNLIQPQATTKHYDASDGVGVTLGNLDVRNMMALTDNEGETASLMFALVNASSSPIDLHLWYNSNGARTEIPTITVDPTTQPLGFGGPGQPQLVLDKIGAVPGAVIEITLQAGDAATRLVQVPVLNTALPEYNGLEPSPVTTPQASPTPTPTSTP